MTDGFVWGFVFGTVFTLITTMLSFKFAWSTEECIHQWDTWTPPDTEGNQERYCKRCNLHQRIEK